jgi:hypothetical protein
VKLIAEGSKLNADLPSTGVNLARRNTVTTTPNELCAELHNWMPVVLAPERWRVWLGEEPADQRQLKNPLAPYPSEAMTCWPVSARVGNVKNNDPSLIARAKPYASGRSVALRWVNARAVISPQMFFGRLYTRQ